MSPGRKDGTRILPISSKIKDLNGILSYRLLQPLRLESTNRNYASENRVRLGMRHFRWDKESEVFLAQIDAEHCDLFRVADQLERAIAENAPADQIDVYLHSLVDHFNEHFSHEEWLMQSTAYPSYGWHRNQHDTARRRLKLFVPLVEAGDKEGSELFFEFLAGWLQDHTSVTDRMMGAYIRNYERAHGFAISNEPVPSAGAAPVEARESDHPKHAAGAKNGRS